MAANKKSNKNLIIIAGALLGLFVVGVVVSAGYLYLRKDTNNNAGSLKKDTYVDPKFRQWGGSDTKRGENLEKPANWPADVAIYNGNIKLTNAARDGNAFTLGITTIDEVSAIKDFYVEGLESEGWQKAKESRNNKAINLAYRKGNRRSVNIVIKKDPADKAQNIISESVKQ